MGALGILPAIPAIVPSLALGTTVGTPLYVIGVIATGGVAIYAQWRELRGQRRAQAERDNVIKRMAEDMTALVNTMRSVEQRLPAGSPERQALDKNVGMILKNYNLKPGTGEIKIMGYAPRVTLTRPDGTVEFDSDA
jgi:hypothetical protein